MSQKMSDFIKSRTSQIEIDAQPTDKLVVKKTSVPTTYKVAALYDHTWEKLKLINEMTKVPQVQLLEQIVDYAVEHMEIVDS